MSWKMTTSETMSRCWRGTSVVDRSHTSTHKNHEAHVKCESFEIPESVHRISGLLVGCILLFLASQCRRPCLRDVFEGLDTQSSAATKRIIHLSPNRRPSFNRPCSSILSFCSSNSPTSHFALRSRPSSHILFSWLSQTQKAPHGPTSSVRSTKISSTALLAS